MSTAKFWFLHYKKDIGKLEFNKELKKKQDAR